MIDVIVVGSGASAVHAAWPAAEAGLRVLMLDVGERDEKYSAKMPTRSFTELREEDPNQHHYFLGENFEGIPLGPVRVGAQLTPPRQHLARIRQALLPTKVSDFHAMQSHALGGLGAGWGAAVPPFTDEDMEGWPITRALLQPHYDAVSRRVGISGSADDDLAKYLGESPFLLPPARMDSNGEFLMHAYGNKRRELNRKGLHVGHARLAMATKRFRGRGPAQYHDLDFWSDADQAVYRPRYTLEELTRYAGFDYRRRMLVRRFITLPDGTVEVEALNIDTETVERIRCARLILAAGTLGTTRIALHSLGAYNERVPLVSNPYTYFPCLVWKRLGQKTRDRRHSLTQLMMYYDPQDKPGKALQGQVYSYRSLLTFKLVKESPLPHRETIRMMRVLQSYFVILGVHHEDRATEYKYIQMAKGEEDAPPTLEIHYLPTPTETRHRQRLENQLLPLVKKLGCLPIKRIDPGEGSSIHYAGTLPMSREDRPLTTTPNGALRGAPGVFVADGCVLPHLPAKGLTYTLMANADRIGTQVMRSLLVGR